MMVLIEIKTSINGNRQKTSYYRVKIPKKQADDDVVRKSALLDKLSEETRQN